MHSCAPHPGHTTVALRFDGELYICESTTASAYWPTPHVQRTPYEQVGTETHWKCMPPFVFIAG
jgi:hypothetical protein